MTVRRVALALVAAPLLVARVSSADGTRDVPRDEILRGAPSGSYLSVRVTVEVDDRWETFTALERLGTHGWKEDRLLLTVRTEDTDRVLAVLTKAGRLEVQGILPMRATLPTAAIADLDALLLRLQSEAASATGETLAALNHRILRVRRIREVLAAPVADGTVVWSVDVTERPIPDRHQTGAGFAAVMVLPPPRGVAGGGGIRIGWWEAGFELAGFTTRAGRAAFVGQMVSEQRLGRRLPLFSVVGVGVALSPERTDATAPFGLGVWWWTGSHLSLSSSARVPVFYGDRGLAAGLMLTTDLSFR